MAQPYWSSESHPCAESPLQHPSFTTTSTAIMTPTDAVSQRCEQAAKSAHPRTPDGQHHSSPTQHRPPPLAIHPDSSAFQQQQCPEAYGFHGAAPASYLPYLPVTAQGYYAVDPQSGSTYAHPPHFFYPPHSAPPPGHPAPSITPSLPSMPSTASISSLASVSSSPHVSSTAGVGTTDRHAQSSRTNWEPLADGYGEDYAPPSTATSANMVLPSQAEQDPPMLSRSRRAAANKARSNIASIVTSLRSPPLAPRSVNRLPALPSRPNSANSSLRSGITSTASPAMSQLSLKPAKPREAILGRAGVLRVPIKYHPNQPTIMLELQNHRGVLLEAPPGAQLEVNELLILHPPSLSPNANLKPVNQYNHPPGLVSDGLPIDGYRSMYEMYTCRVCSKTYDGRNARSVARRHLQDKHGVKLALQKRRTRWDLEPDRPKTAVAAREKTLKSKRDWATRTRQLHRLEKAHAKFLERYGPNGIYTPCSTHLTAPSMRAPVSAAVRNKTYPDGRLAWDRIPRALRDSLATLVGIEVPRVEVEYEDADDEDYEEDQSIDKRNAQSVEPAACPPTPIIQPVGRSRRGKQIKSAASVRGASARKNNDGRQTSPVRFAVPQGPSLQRTPVSNSRARSGPTADEEDEEVEEELWSATWGSATAVDEMTLQVVMAQYNEHDTITGNRFDIVPLDATVVSPVTSIGNDGSTSPAPTGETHEMPHSTWVSPQEVMDAADVSSMWYARAQTYDYSSSSAPFADKAWLALPSPDIVRVNTPSHNSAGGDVVAAESLLNLHSTPARPEDEDGHTSGSSSGTLDPTRSSTRFESVQTASSAIRGLLDAPDITPRPQSIRARSFIQPFNKSRPDAMTRSLSFSQQMLDDPFAISPNTTALLKAADESLNGKRRRDVMGASPSPLTKRKKEEHRCDGLDRFGSPRRPMTSLRPNLHSVSAGNMTTSGMEGRISTMGATVGLGFSGYASMSSSGGSTELRTPVRSRGSHVPSSLNKMWQFSSPSDPGAAASLGLVPSWGSMLGGGTPGVSGLVASESPLKVREALRE